MRFSVLTSLLICISAVFFAPVADAQTQDDFNFFFIHQSVGENWLKPNVGALRDTLENPALNDFIFDVHDAFSMDGDLLAQQTMVVHWLPKFETQLDLILTFDYSPNAYYTNPDEYNHIVMFKSCYIANDIDGLGTPPGDPYSNQKTIWNYKATFLALADIFKDYPHILWIPVTPPPRNALDVQYSTTRGTNACAFNDWMAGEYVDNYRKETGLNNMAVFDMFGDVLANPITHPTAPGALKEMYCQPNGDSHPNNAGSQAMTAAYIPFINQAVHDWLQFLGDKNTISVTSQDSVNLHLNAGAANANRPYRVLGSFTGVEPGFEYMQLHIPLNYDDFLRFTYFKANSSGLQNFFGTLDGTGQADAVLNSPGAMGPWMIGRQVHFAYVLYYPLDFASGVVPIECVP